MSTKSSNWIDARIGATIRRRRKRRGMSQEKLGEAIGVSFQQVQKYENGSNRLSCSRLWEVGQALGIAPASLIPPRNARKPKVTAQPRRRATMQAEERIGA